MTRSNKTHPETHQSPTLAARLYRFVMRGFLPLALTVLGSTLLFVPLPVIPPVGDRALMDEVIAYPVFLLLFAYWYLGRTGIAGVGSLLHTAWKRSTEDHISQWESGAGKPIGWPSVSILVPAFNEEDCIEETVQHFAGLDYPGEIEVVVVDDGSTDGTWALLQQLAAWYPAGFLSIHTKENEGIGPTLNHALSFATNEVIVRVDADTRLKNDALREAVRPFTDPDVVSVAGNVTVGNDTASLWTRLQSIEYGVAMEVARQFQFRLKHVLCVSGSFSTFRREVLDRVGGWNENPAFSEDFDLSIRMHHEGEVAFTPDAIAYTEAPTTLRGWAKQRIWWARIGVRTLVHQRRAQLNPSYSGAGLIGLPIQTLVTGALVVQTTALGWTVATAPAQLVQLAHVAVIGYVTTTAFSLFLIAILLVYCVNDRLPRHVAVLPAYFLIYRVLHVTVKVIGIAQAGLELCVLIVRGGARRLSLRRAGVDKEPAPPALEPVEE